MTHLRRLRCLFSGHRMRYAGGGDWTGYIEKCERCDLIVQVPQ